MSIARLRYPIVLLLGLCVVRAAASPAVELHSGPPKVQGFPVGTKIVWMSMVCERVQNESHMTVLRGVQTVDASGKLEVDRADRDYSRSLWLLADLDGGWAVHGATAQYPPSREVLAVQTQKGADRLIVHAQSIHLTWSSGHGIWLFAGADGGGQDADGLQTA